MRAACLSALLLGTAADPPGVQIIFEGVRMDRYPVRGRDVAAVRAALDAARVRDEQDGTMVEAYTHGRIQGTWQAPARADHDAPCRPEAVIIRYSATMRLPYLAEPDPLPELAQAWRLYALNLERHEAQHLERIRRALPRLAEAIAAAPCTGADAAGAVVLDEIRADGRAYDTETEHGRREGAVFPPPRTTERRQDD
ncbi:DUF922 domain-containing protein [uncultured Sphingomonas sp.]|uniref:DUF922 domain-containing protein n=1 Tax=uncultured Sphingomonas sp. TaxID=158754 RepID=UPI0026243757|nr:DUF922 domain-containing protein [uncultured Sphingomonas sp.]